MGKTVFAHARVVNCCRIFAHARVVNCCRIFALALSALVVVGCASGHCRGRKPEKTIFVYKDDGSRQCGQGKAISVGDMQKELVDIPVMAAENKSDGLLRMQMCGAPTGQVNVYKIPESFLEEAKKRGFKEFKP